MAILAMVITPLFITEGSVIQTVARFSFKLRRLFVAENFLLTARNQAADEVKFKLEKKFDDPVMNVTYEQKAVNKKSSLKKMQNVVTEYMTIEWQDRGKKQQDVLVSFLYKQPSSSKKKAS